MVAVSGALIFAGYQLLAYGWSQLQHSNVGFFDLLWPGRLTAPNYKAPPDDGSGSSTSGGGGGGAAAALGSGSTSKQMPGGSTGATTILGK